MHGNFLDNNKFIKSKHGTLLLPKYVKIRASQVRNIVLDVLCQCVDQVGTQHGR